MLALNLASGCTKKECEGCNPFDPFDPTCVYGNHHKICGCYWDSTLDANDMEIGCTVPRTDQEVCQPISKYYSPLFIKGKLTYFGTPVLECDDVFGAQEGEYHCLGIVMEYICVIY
jgi:hypothetical protein